jgi:hypothetical protein
MLQVDDIVRHLIHGCEGIVVSSDGFIAKVNFTNGYGFGHGFYAAQYGVIKKIGRVTKWKNKPQ